MNKTDIKNLPRLYTDEEIANTTEIEFFYISCLYGGRGGCITDPEQIRIIMEGCRIGDTELSEGGMYDPPELRPNGSDKTFSLGAYYYTDKDPDEKILGNAIYSNEMNYFKYLMMKYDSKQEQF